MTSEDFWTYLNQQSQAARGPAASSTYICGMNVPHTSALYWNCANVLWWKCTSVSRSICIIMWFSSDNTCLNQHLTQQVPPTCACCNFMHNWISRFFQSTSTIMFMCVESNSAVHGKLAFAAHCVFNWSSCLLKQSGAVCMTPNYIKHPNMLALALCTSERYDWTGHICCGYNAHQV